MNDIPLVSIVTPTLNSEKYIEQTIKSVFDLNYTNIEYIIVDGESNDQTLQILEKYKKKIKILVRKDNSMYEALDNGFKIANGKYLCWINSDDFLFKDGISNAVKFMQKNKIEWINGVNSFCINNKITSVPLPYFFPRNYILEEKCHKADYGFIPQESVIFSKKLYIESGGFDLNKKLSGDFYLWKSFSKITSMHPVNIKIGVFRKRKGQLTEDLSIYYNEIGKKYKKKFNLFRLCLSLLFQIYFFISKFFNKK